MSVKSIVSQITKDDNTLYSVSSSNCSGIFIFDTSSFTDKMKRELMGVLVEIYTDNGIRIKNRSVLWSAGDDEAIIAIDLPESIKVRFVPIIDERYIKTFPDDGPVDTTYPVKIKFDDTPIGGSGGGGGGSSPEPQPSIEVLDGDIADNPSSGKVVTSAQVFNFVMDNDVLVYNDSNGNITDNDGSSGGSGSGPLGSINVLDGNIIDNPDSNDVVTSNQTYGFVISNPNIPYIADP